MSNLFSSKKIVDREYETKYFVDDINKSINSYKNKIFFIWSDSGIGKTSIVEKISKDSSLNKPVVIIDTPPINNKSIVGNGDFISYIADGISIFLKTKDSH